MDREITWGAAWSLSGFGEATLFLFQMDMYLYFVFLMLS